MAQQTNFVKLSIMQIKILNNWYGKFILIYEIKSQTLANANRRSIHFWDTLCKKNQNLIATKQKSNSGFKRSAWELNKD